MLFLIAILFSFTCKGCIVALMAPFFPIEVPLSPAPSDSRLT